MNRQTLGNILIADDNPDNLRMISEQLGDSNYEIRVARDGFGALENIQAEPPDLILMAILMPHLDGFELCRRLKKDARYRDIPIIIIGDPEESFNKKEIFQSGAVDYLVKPFEIEEVQARVKIHIEHYMVQKTLKELHQKFERQMEERSNELREREAILKGFIEGSDDAICIRDRERRLILWNQQFASGVKANCGVDVKVGMRAEEYISEEIFAQFEEQRKSLYPAIEGKSTQAEYPFPGKDGETRYFDVRWTPVVLDGEVFGVAEVTRDITEQKQINIKLNESNERFSAYMQNSTEAIWCFDLKEPVDISLPVEEQLDLIYKHAYLTECNDAYAKLAGLKSREELMGITLAEIMPRDKPENVAQLMDVIKNQYTTTGFDSLERYPSGEERILLNNSVGIIIDGFMHRTWGTAIDITRLRTAQKKLKQAEQRYRTVADFTYDWEYWQGQDGRMIYVSPSCERISGFSPNDFITNEDLLDEIVIKEDSSLWQRRECNIEKEIVREPESFLFRILRKDGEPRWIEHVCQPVYDSDGNALGIRASNRDVTQRKLAEENVQRSEQQLRLIADSLPVFISYVSADETYLFNNKAYLDFFNLTTDQIIGQPIKDVLGPDTYRHVHPHVKKALDGERSGFEVEILRGATKHHIESTYMPDRDHNGVVNGFFVLATDVTERKYREAELQRHREELAHVSRLTTMGELTASLAHELNQPLTAILSNAQAARRFLDHDTVDIEEIKDILDDIIGDDRRAGQVIKRLRSFLKRGEFHLKSWDINEVIQEVVTLVHSDAVIRNVSIHLDLQKELPQVQGDRIQVQQVLLNLIINGLDAMITVHPESRKLIIRTEYERGNIATVSVGDSGTGIRPDQMQLIFEPFHTTKADGMGMGLSINRSIIGTHHGKLWAENNTDQGATFYFTLPIASGDNIGGQ